MTNKNILTEDDTKKVTGGGYIKWWRCNTCLTEYHKKFPEKREIDGVEERYCTVCQAWYPREEWYRRVV